MAKPLYLVQSTILCVVCPACCLKLLVYTRKWLILLHHRHNSCPLSRKCLAFLTHFSAQNWQEREALLHFAVQLCIVSCFSNVCYAQIRAYLLFVSLGEFALWRILQGLAFIYRQCVTKSTELPCAVNKRERERGTIKAQPHGRVIMTYVYWCKRA